MKKYDKLGYNELIVRKPVSELTMTRSLFINFIIIDDKITHSKVSAKKDSNLMNKIIKYQ